MAEADHNPELIGPGGKVDRDALFAAFEASEEATGDDEAPVTVRFELSRDLEKRLDKYLVDRIPFLSRTSLQQLIKENEELRARIARLENNQAKALAR